MNIFILEKTGNKLRRFLFQGFKDWFFDAAFFLGI